MMAGHDPVLELDAAIERLLGGEAVVAVEEDVGRELIPFVELFAGLLEITRDQARPEFRRALRARFVGSHTSESPGLGLAQKVAAIVAATFLVGSTVNPALARTLVNSIGETMGAEIAEVVDAILSADAETPVSSITVGPAPAPHQAPSLDIAAADGGTPVSAAVPALPAEVVIPSPGAPGAQHTPGGGNPTAPDVATWKPADSGTSIAPSPAPAGTVPGSDAPSPTAPVIEAPSAAAAQAPAADTPAPAAPETPAAPVDAVVPAPTDDVSDRAEQPKTEDRPEPEPEPEPTAAGPGKGNGNAAGGPQGGPGNGGEPGANSKGSPQDGDPGQGGGQSASFGQVKASAAPGAGAHALHAPEQAGGQGKKKGRPAGAGPG